MAGQSVGDPIKLSYLLASDRVVAGDVIWLRGGTYAGDFVSALAGSGAARLTFRPYNRETVIIDGSFNTSGAEVDFIELEFTNSRTDRTRSQAEAGTDLVTGSGAGTRFINCIFHDGEVDGLGWWKQAEGALVYGCVSYNNGFINSADGNGDGHGIYTQNTTGIKTFKHNILGPNFNLAFQAYARTDTPQLGWNFLENVVLGGKLYFGGDNSVRQQGVTIDNCHIFGTVQLGDLYTQNGDVVFTNNRLYGGVAGVISGQPLTIKYWEDIELTGNKIVSSHHNLLRFIEPSDTGSNVRTWDNNAYYGAALDALPFNEDGVSDYNLAGWRTAKGFDTNSTVSASIPSGNEIFAYANEYKDTYSKREGLIVVWNWEALTNISIDLSAFGLTSGREYRVRHGVNYAETQTFVYDGSPLSLDMTGWTVAVPNGLSAALIASPFPTFGAFVLECAQ